jgi:linoleate 10R-lipoxygenase
MYRRAIRDTVVDDGPGRSVPVKEGDNVFVSFVGAARDPVVFPDPEQVKIDRPMDSYIHYGEGPHKCLGMDVSKVAITAMLKTVGRLDNLRRAPGPRGELKKIPRPGGFYIYMREDQGGYFPFPTSELPYLLYSFGVERWRE